jgi:hypothetical protein
MLNTRPPDNPHRRQHIMTCKIPLNVVTAPTSGAVLEAPPVLIASEHSVAASAPHMSAFGGRADMTFCAAHVCF